MNTDEGTETGADANAGTETDDADRHLSEMGVGDGREKHVAVVTAGGKEIDHDEVFLRHTETEYLVCADPDFPRSETTRHRKENIDRVKITQHHSNCFITTAAAGEGPTLDSLRGFRADVMRPTRSGRALLRVYEAISPPIAATLDRHPASMTTRLVRRLVDRCGALAEQRRAAVADAERAGLSIALIGLYVVGVAIAALGHGWLRARELTGSVS
jgi:hypothetical protein